MKKKTVSNYLVFAIMVTLLSGCGGDKADTNTTVAGGDKADTNTTVAGGDNGLSEPGVFPITKEKKTITVVAPDTNYILDLNTNDFFTAYEARTNVKVNFEQVAEDAFVEKRNIKMAGGDLPDAFLYGKFSTLDMYQYGSQESFIPLNDLIEKQGVELKKIIELQPELPAAITAPDGNIYGIPRYHNDYHSMYYGKAWINKKWLDTLGLPMPTTTDELITTLEAFKTKDPNGNGKADEIPMTGAENGWYSRPYEFLLNAFVKNDMSSNNTVDARIYVEDGKVDTFANKEEFKQGLKYIKNLIDKGLLDPLSLSQTDTQLSALGNVPNPVIGVGVSNSPWSIYADSDVYPESSEQYVALPPLKGPNGLQHTPFAPGMINGHLIITSAAKNPELVYKWADGMLSEEVTMFSQYGKYEEKPGDIGQGIPRWSKADEGRLSPLGVQAEWQVVKDEKPLPRTQEPNDTAPNVALYYASEKIISTKAVDVKSPLEVDPAYVSLKYYKPYVDKEIFPSSFFLDNATSEEYTILKTDLSSYILQNINNFITGNKDIDKDWDAYIKGFEKLKLTRYIEIGQQIYDDYIKNSK